jgi:tRNA(Glu) U13 pseudouridine synthase TruD
MKTLNLNPRELVTDSDQRLMLLLVRLAILALLFLGMNNKIQAKGLHSDSACMKVKVNVDYKNKCVKDAEVFVYKGNEIIERIFSDAFGKYIFNLKANELYTIEVEKDGYTSRRVIIDTHLPENEDIAGDFYKLEMDIDLMNEYGEAMDEDALEFPIAIFSFDAKHQEFKHDRKYTANLKKEIKSALANSDQNFKITKTGYKPIHHSDHLMAGK